MLLLLDGEIGHPPRFVQAALDRPPEQLAVGGEFRQDPQVHVVGRDPDLVGGLQGRGEEPQGGLARGRQTRRRGHSVLEEQHETARQPGRRGRSGGRRPRRGLRPGARRSHVVVVERRDRGPVPVHDQDEIILGQAREQVAA